MFTYTHEDLEANINGKVYKFRQPTASEQKEMSTKFKEEVEGKDPIDLYFEFFEQLGLSREVTSTMSQKGILDLFAYSLGQKKS